VRYGIEVVNFGSWADPRPIVELARAAEAAGWDGLFLWDHLGVGGVAAGDPWIALAAVAAVTDRLRLGTGVTPLPRHRPQMLARTLSTLDLLSGGRVTLGVGLGGPAAEYESFGESADRRVHASMVDEGLEVLDGLWSGQAVTYAGRHYAVRSAALLPAPVQRPRIPIWVGGESPAALRRVARWDGWIIGGVSPDGTMSRTPEQMAASVAAIERQREAVRPFDVAMTGYTQPEETALPRAYADAGVTWWLESLHGYRGSRDELLARVRAGPPA
jgi:probable F420-dependent oxidoreductase